MIDRYVCLLKGWKITDREHIEEVKNVLEEVGYYDNVDNGLEDFIVDDTMCGNYIYFGTKALYQNANEDWSGVEVNTNLFNNGWDKFKKWVNTHRDVWQKLEPFCVEWPRTYLFMHTF